jgi:hypothetical protein
MIDSLLLTAARISTFEHERGLTHASGFFFEREGRLFLVTSRHVLIDEPTKHHPNRIEIEIHTSDDDLARSTGFSLLLFEDGKSVWRQGKDAGGEIDVALIELDRDMLPDSTVLRAFTPAHLVHADSEVEVGSSVLIVEEPQALRFQRGLGARAHVELAVDLLHVVGNGVPAQAQLHADLGQRVALGHAQQHFAFAVGQVDTLGMALASAAAWPWR